MTITVEDGSGVAGANSYVTVADLTAYAAARGISLPATDPEKEVLLVKAMDVLEAMDSRYIGVRTYPDLLSWPRTFYDNDPYEKTEIPSNLKNAQIAYAIAAQTVDLMPVLPGTATTSTKKRIKAGSVEIEYADAASTASVLPTVTAASAYLAPLMQSGTGGQMRVIRG